MSNLNFEGFNLIYYTNDYVVIQCIKCGAIRKHSRKYYNKFKHGQDCSIYYRTIIRNVYGERTCHIFCSKYNSAKNRCTNINNKDYNTYSLYGWKFEDFSHFYICEFKNFINAVSVYGIENISIDRIDGNRGYEPGNIRFVPMFINLQNKSIIKKVKYTNLYTNEIKIFNSTKECGDALNIPYTRVWECCNRENKIYKNIHKFEFIN